MPVYAYRGFADSGEVLKGVITADTIEEARAALRRRGIHIQSVKQASSRKRLFGLFKGRGREEVITISRQLATLLRSGTNLSKAISLVLKQTRFPGLRAALMHVHESLQRGVSFGSAIEEFPEYFSRLYVSMVKAGESSGTLDTALSRLAEYYQKRRKVMSRLASAMVYPVFVMSVGAAVVVFLMTFIVPELLSLLTQGMGSRGLPLPTRMLIALSGLFTGYWFLLVAAAAAAGGGFWWFLRGEKGRYIFDRIVLRLPVIGPLLEKTAVARFAHTLATLLKSGIPPLDALLVVQDVLNNAYLERAVRDVRRGIMDGKDMSAELEKTGVFPPIVGHMVAVGEESGELERLLEEIAEAYDTEVALATEKAIAVLEPVMIVLMATVIGFIVFAVVLPILEIGNII